MRHFNLAVIVSIVLLGGEVFAQNNISGWIIQHGLSTDYPILHKVTLGCNVRYDRTQSMYYYDYTLTSEGGNKGDIWYFEIDISRYPGSVAYDTSGLKFTSDFERNLFRRYYSGAANVSVPVGFPTLPSSNWTSDIEHDTVASFANGLPFVKPDSSVNGFTMMSKALPGIRAFTAYSAFDEGKYEPDIDEDTTAALDSIYTLVGNFIDSMTAKMNYHGWTIGPTAPPLDFSAASWIDTLASFKERSLALGWIDNQGIANSLDSKLDNAKSRLAAGDTTAAKNVLDAFVNEVEAQNGKHLTSEAYALLRYNAEYLIQRMP